MIERAAMFTSSLTLSSLLGVVVVFYLCSFLLFAVLRIITGVSIQRFGYLSIRGIQFSSGGVDFNIVRAGILLHRPTFSQPTWISLVIRDSTISFNPKPKPDISSKPGRVANGKPREEESIDPKAKPVRSSEDLLEFLKDGGDDMFKRRTKRQVEETKKLVERCRKILHLFRRFVGWIKMVDVIFNNTTFEVRQAGKIQIGAVGASIIARKDSRSHSNYNSCDETEGANSERHPFECVIACRSILLTPQGGKPVLLSDTINLNIGGVLEEKDQVLKDVSIDMKVGKLRIPLDEIISFQNNIQNQTKPQRPLHHKRNLSLGSIMGEMSMPGSRTERLVEIVTESKEIFSSVINGLHEVQATVAILEISKVANDIRPSGKPLIATMSLKELGLDLHKLEQDSPAHRMDFSPNDIAHQALLAAISLAFKIDDQMGKVDQLLYVPMVTMTSKLTLPSKIIELAECPEADRNSNVVNASIVITSPSVDLEPKHLPIVVNLFKQRKSRPRNHSFGGPQQLISRLLPKTNIKFSVHEPVVRVLLPAFDKANPKNPPLTDMLIFSISSSSHEIESSHVTGSQNHYVLTTSLRIASSCLFYRAAGGERHDLFQLDTLEVKAQLDASPEVRLAGTCEIASCTTRMVRTEIVQGIKQMVKQFQRDFVPERSSPNPFGERPSFLRSIPEWLVQFKVDGKDFSFEVAGKDEQVSEDVRGAAIQMDSWSLEYKSQVISKSREKSHPKRRTSRAIGMDEKIPLQGPRPSKNPTDGRRLSFHIHGLEGFAVDSAETWDADPMCALPHFEVALSSVTDQDGPTLLITSHTKTLFLHYSLLRHYSVLIAARVLKDAFGDFRSVKTPKHFHSPTEQLFPSPTFGGLDIVESPMKQEEFVSVDVRIRHVKIKGDFAKNPKVMLDIYHLDAGRQRWGFPYLKARNIRFYVTSPKLGNCWARVISAKHFRGDMREGRYENQKVFSKRKSLDLTMEAIRIAIPHQLVLYKVTDNLVNAAKASQQLFHQFKSGAKEFPLEKKAEEAKILPRISIKAKALQFELEDDLFESKLSMIYRIGLSEQKNRIAREEAYDAKVAKVIESKNRRHSTRTTHPAKPTPNGINVSDTGSVVTDKDGAEGDQGSPTTDSRGRRKMRYNLDHAQGPTCEASISINKAWWKLQEHNSQVWIRKMKMAIPKTRTRIQAMRRKFLGEDDLPPDVEETERILEVPARPALAIASIVDFDLTLDKPSFPLEHLPKFLHKVGKGLPEDTKFSLLVPMHIKLNMGEARINLRDYPLPLLHIPQMKSGLSPRIPAWSLETDFVIAEELRDKNSMLHVKVDIVPPEDREGKKQKGFAVDVHRTVSPVKTYSDIDITINTPYTTRATWGTSYQPAIQDMMMVFETFTKPHVDPSEKIGFWDKLRLSIHSRIRWAWKGDGDVQVTLKGSRDPYVITGNGAGFVKCWRGDVRCYIANDDKPLNFLIVESKEYFLAIPDFSQQALQIFEDTSTTTEDDQSFMSNDSYNKTIAIFKKVILKATGGVRWQLGLVFEQETSQEADWIVRQRSFAFLPHYKITLRTPEAAKALQQNSDQVYDAFRGFRSHHIHLSISMVAPINHDWTSNKMASAYNTIHLTPRVFTHFYDWVGLFSGVMSLPIRQGRLFPGIEKSTKKFGRHLATIKYKLLLSPLYLSHIYRHKDAEEYKAEAAGGAPTDTITATGLKVKLHRFTLDAHQRKEESVMKIKGFNVDRRSTNMSINQAELDFTTADIRAVSATIASSTSDDVKDWAGFDLPANDDTTPLGDSSNFSISDGDTDWIDVDDFVELDWVLPTRYSPSTKIMPLASTPRFTYFRQTDHSSGEGSTGRKGRSPFGHEATHDCMMNQNNDPREIQCEFIQSRMEKVHSQLRMNKELLNTLAESIKQDKDNQKLMKESERLIQQSSVLTDKIKFLQNMLRNMSKYLDESAIDDDNSSISSKSDDDVPMMDAAEPYTKWDDDFNNRFIVHNMQAKWSNDLRNVILRYIHQVNQRRGFVYYMSRRAVKFILDLVDEQQMDREKKQSQELDPDRASIRGVWENGPQDTEESGVVQSRIEALLNDKAKVVAADDDARPRSRRMSMGGAPADPTDLKKGISEEYIPLNSYHVRLISPQIQMQSEKNKSSALLVTSQSMQLTVISVMDKERISDPVSGLVQRRFALELENAQAFVARHKDFTSPLHNLHSNNQYGCVKNTSWPPWVPMENMLLFDINPHGFSRVVKKTSTTLRADKHNSLRLKLIDEGLDTGSGEHNASLVENEPRVDHVWATFDRMEVSTNSAEYYTLYIIVLDLLLYSEPLEKSRNERLEKIILASDFSDLKGAENIITALQGRIQQLEEIKTHFQINARNLDKQGWIDRMCLEKDLATCEDELFFTMKSIMSVQRKYDERQQTTGLIRWYLSAGEIIANLLLNKDQPFVDLKLTNACYERTDNSDGSNFNTVEVEMLQGVNRLPDATYPAMISPYLEGTLEANKAHQNKILRVYWYMLEAIAGIPVMDHFEVNLFPLLVQLDYDAGQKLFEFIFPGVNSNSSEGFSPFMMKPSLSNIPDGSDSESDSDNAIRAQLEQKLSSESSQPQPQTDAGLLGDRLLPTTTSEKRPHTSGGLKTQRPTTAHADSDKWSLKPRFTMKRQQSFESLPSLAKKAADDGAPRTSSESSAVNGRSASPVFIRVNSVGNSEHASAAAAAKKAGVWGRNNSITAQADGKQKEKTDEISQMISRASNYMTLAYIKIPSVVLCLSYKGKGDRNIEDIHQFVFRMPTLEYRNKTWSNLDLLVRLKKDVIRALISHTGAIIEHKVFHRRPNLLKGANLRNLVASSMSAATTPLGSDSDVSSYLPSSYEESIRSGSVSTSNQTAGPSKRDRSNSSGLPLSHRASIRSRSGTRAGSVRSDRSYSSASAHRNSSEQSTDDGSSSAPGSREGDETQQQQQQQQHGIFHNTLGRHLSILTNDRRARDGIAGESEESIRKKSRLLLGKKLLGSG
ncbi:hypothetical protein TWF192_008367 [Orbilia oligospora]|uniref:FMP27 GFWDK domain-containing protein n=1 Tax=Orbilia oligospora TaxID=2813651 RepID=A0A6G1M3W9_ORBOL|nr:hypothetical protein TWF191_010716 [Orbilia oligospora]KAF3243461.1 hypothetical protein TWF192_008367 [Orbilia oligospora]